MAWTGLFIVACGLLLAVSPLLAVAVEYIKLTPAEQVEATNSGFGAGAAVAIVTFPVGGLIAAAGALVATRGLRRVPPRRKRVSRILIGFIIVTVLIPLGLSGMSTAHSDPGSMGTADSCGSSVDAYGGKTVCFDAAGKVILDASGKPAPYVPATSNTTYDARAELALPIAFVIVPVLIGIATIQRTGRKHWLRLAPSQPVPGAATGGTAFAVNGAETAEPTAGTVGTVVAEPAPTPHAPRTSKPVPSERAGKVLLGSAMALTALGAYINPHRGADAKGFYAAVSPIDCWWLAALCAVVGTFIRQAHRRAHAPQRFWGRTLLWCGVVVLSWSFLITVLMGLGAGIGDYINQAFDSGGIDEGFSPLGLLTGSGSGPFLSMFPGIAAGTVLMVKGVQKSNSAAA